MRDIISKSLNKGADELHDLGQLEDLLQSDDKMYRDEEVEYIL